MILFRVYRLTSRRNARKAPSANPRPTEIASIVANGKCGAPLNLKKNAARTPSNASEPNTKLTTGSTIASNMTTGRLSDLQRTQRAPRPISLPFIRLRRALHLNQRRFVSSLRVLQGSRPKPASFFAARPAAAHDSRRRGFIAFGVSKLQLNEVRMPAELIEADRGGRAESVRNHFVRTRSELTETLSGPFR